MDWSIFIPGLMVGILSVIIARYVKKVKYPQELDLSNGAVEFRGNYFAGFISLVLAVGFALGFLLFPVADVQFWIYLLLSIPLVYVFLHFAYYAFFSRIIFRPDQSIEYRCLHQRVNFQLSDIKAVRARKSGLRVELTSGKKLFLCTVLEHHQNLFGYLYAKAGNAFSKSAKKRLENDRAFVEVI